MTTARWSSRVIVLDRDAIDTDQILPAAFLGTTSRDGLGEALFFHWRRDAAGALRPDSVLDHGPAAGSSILLAGRDFGCGSSREHAVWALRQFGIRAVVARGFAEIFHDNALENGLLPLELGEAEHRALRDRLRDEPTLAMEIDLRARRWRLSGEEARPFELGDFAQEQLLSGRRTVELLVARRPSIEAFERRHEIDHPAPRDRGASLRTGASS